MQLHVFRVQARFCRHGGSQHRTSSGGQNAARVAVVGVDNRLVTAAEQLGFRVAVGIHGFMEVQMVLRQVGKSGNSKVNTAHTLQCQGMAGNLHHHMGAVTLPHPGEQGLQIKAFRGSALGGNHFLPDHVRHGADQPHLGPQRLFQHLLEKQGRRRLAVGAGNADHGHGSGRIAVEIAAQQGQRQPVGCHQNVRNRPFRRFRGDYRHGTFFQRHGNKAVAVGGKAGHRHEQAARLRLPGVIANCGNVPLQICRARQNLNILQ